MAFSRGSHRRKKTSPSQETNPTKTCLLNEGTFLGLLFKKDVNNTKSTLTTLRNRPNVIFAEKDIILFDYSLLEETNKDLDQIHATFSTLTPQKSTFTLSNARYVQDDISIDVTMNGTYQFLNFINDTIIVAKWTSSTAIGNYDKAKWSGKYFLETPQFTVDKIFSSKKIDVIENLIHQPNWSDWGIMAGDKVRFVGTKYNDELDALVISTELDENMLSLSEINQNESAIGTPVKMQLWRNCSSLDAEDIYETQEPTIIQSTGNKKGNKKFKKRTISNTSKQTTGNSTGTARSVPTLPPPSAPPSSRLGPAGKTTPLGSNPIGSSQQGAPHKCDSDCYAYGRDSNPDGCFPENCRCLRTALSSYRAEFAEPCVPGFPTLCYPEDFDFTSPPFQMIDNGDGTFSMDSDQSAVCLDTPLYYDGSPGGFPECIGGWCFSNY